MAPKRVYVPIACSWCGAEFMPTHPASTRCSAECKRLAKIAYAREWNLAHPERVRETNHRWHAANRELKQARDAERYAQNPDRIKETSAAWKARNPDRLREYVKRRLVTHREMYREAARRRRARVAAAPGRITATEWERVQHAFEYRCAYCGAIGEMQMEHVVPLDRVDLEPTHCRENILPACRTCNSRKQIRLISEWRPHLVEALAERVQDLNPGLAAAIRTTT